MVFRAAHGLIRGLQAVSSTGVTPSGFYRSNADATIDLLLNRPSGGHLAIEVKRGFYSACDNLKPVKKWVIYPGTEACPLNDDIQAMPLHAAMWVLADRRRD